MLGSAVLSTGRRVSIYQDEFAENPREWCNTARLLCIKNRHFSLDDDLSQDELSDEHREALERGDYVFPLFVYIHSGIVFSVSPFSCRWDSGQCGVAIVPKGGAKDENAALDIVTSEIETLNKYLAGAVYVLTVEHPEGFDVVCDDSLSGNYIDNEADLIDCIEQLDLTDGELKEVRSRIDELM